MKMRRSGLIAVLLVAWLTCAALAAEQQVLFQTSTLQALMNGVYDGDFSFAELKKHGDLGLGTFEALDGEMVAVDGRFYQVKTDGQVYAVAPTQKTPFAEVTFFRTDQTLDATEIPDLKQLERYLSERLPSPNGLYAFKITGKFSYIKTRSVPRQVKPYASLAEVAKHQQVFEFQNVDGVIVGFFHPRFLAGVNVAGYHFHFLTADRRAGGHLLDCRLQQARVEWSRINDFQLRLPGTAEFSRTDLSGDKKQEIDQVER
ncbi:MAG: acetolactate decarboxylase [Desulfobaccales bacterium]